MVLARITSKGQITIPKEVRERLGVEPGDSLEFLFEENHLEVRRRRRRSVMEFHELFAVPEAYDFEEERERARAERVRHWNAGDPSPDG